MDPQTYLESIVPTREMVGDFADPREGGSSFDPELGWVLRDGVRKDGVHGSKGFYRYDPDGARRAVHFPERPCRVHTYGDSFTHCDQVSDGETWQEYLAAHLQEPIRNFGIGGYSVYQAYRRMRKVEREGGAEYIILNVYDDDHFRNLDAWRSIRMGIPGRFTLPHL
ncbi:MAG: SGNH/GDSL hydrolase family protein [Candidatus Latescibacteria bacterium]|nr:SGNH/GDSL hydrolase family protein [Candidatus Latescibacterota bacterium]